MYYICIENEDGSAAEHELQVGSIYCKCSVCGQKYAPFLICFSEAFRAEPHFDFDNLCYDCRKKRDEDRRQRQYNKTVEKMATMLSQAYKKDVTTDEVRTMVADLMESEEDVATMLVKRFGAMSQSGK